MRITAEVAEVTSDSGSPIGSTVRINEDRIEALAFEAATSLATLLRTRFDEDDHVFVTVNASVVEE